MTTTSFASSAPIDIAIIGAGIVGLATGLELATSYPYLSICIVDKEAKIAAHQTSHNSGVIHSGIYYKPNSLKARLCASGAAEMIRFCGDHGVPYEACGKVIVATDRDEIPRMEELLRRGTENGLAGLKRISKEEIREIEPYASGIAGIHVPGTAIVDYSKVSAKYSEVITAKGGHLLLSHEVVGIRRSNALTVIETTQGEIRARLVINCAGLQSDRISKLGQAKLDIRIVPFRGEYYDLVPEKQHCLRGLIYPVPDPRFPFLGVHFTRRIGGGVEAGPNAVLALKREGYLKSSFSLRDVADFVDFPGFWIMAAKYWQTSLGEYYRSWSKRAFVRALQRLMPEITEQDLVPGGSGVRAQALGINGKLIDDFHFAHTEGMVHVCNVPSPAATASLAIGKYIAKIVMDRLDP